MPFLLVILIAFPVFARDLIVHTSLMMDNSSDEANSEIFLMDIQTKKSERLTNNKFMDFTPTLHPSGNLVAFVSDRFRYDVWGDSQIVLKDLTTGKEERLDIGMRKWAHKPKFSPDGKYLYFSMARTPGSETPMGSYKIYRYDLESNKLEPIAPYDRGNFFDVAPSLDSKSLAFRFAADGDQHVRIMDLEKRESRPLTQVRPDNLPEEMPSWRSATELTLVADYGEHDIHQRSLFSVSLAGTSLNQILRSPLINDYHGACWFSENRGVLSAADNASGTLELFLVDEGNLTRISSSEFWWSGEADCRSL